MIKGFEELKLKDNLPKRMRYYQGMIDLNILEKAKENCEYLVVGVSTDELVKEFCYIYMHI